MKTSLFSVSFAGLWGQAKLSLEESIDKTAALGFDGIEIMGKRPHLSVLDYSEEDCVALKTQLDNCGLAASTIAAYTNFTGGMSSLEVPFVEMQLSYVEQLAKRAKILGAPLVRIFTSYERQDMPYARQWQITVDAVRECCDRAAAYGVLIGVQNHHDIGVDTKAMRLFLEQVNRSNLLPMHDCWSVFLRGEDLASGVRQMAPRMRFTTVADYVTIPRDKYRPDMVNYTAAAPAFCMAVPMGEGELDYSTFFTELKAAGFEGWVSYETCSPLRDGGSLETIESYAREFLNYMKRF